MSEPFGQSRDLGAFIRAHRERLAPAAVGLAQGSRRRTPGLRREEVAQLCGLSTTWYTWIEQGRLVSPSPGALARLAKVLQLGAAERAYLFALAGKRDPDQGRNDDSEFPLALRDCVTAIAAPAYILDRGWNARSWNKSAERLFVGWLDRADERNLLRFIFLAPGARALICAWEERARRVAAEFRAATGPHLGDPALRDLVASLHRASSDFARFWDHQEVLGREGGARSFNHPRDGFLRFEQITFDLAGRTDLKLTMLIPRETNAPKARGAIRARRSSPSDISRR